MVHVKMWKFRKYDLKDIKHSFGEKEIHFTQQNKYKYILPEHSKHLKDWEIFEDSSLIWFYTVKYFRTEARTFSM